MKVLLFQIYGNQRAYHLELTYSILSAARFLKQDPAGIRLVLAADMENQRPDLPVDHLLITPEMLHEWQMDGSYNHAIQAYALHHAVRHFDAPVILIDSDTVIREHPRRLFDRIGPGKALMHAREGKLRDSPEWPEWSALDTVAGWRIEPDSVMYNAGVLGLDPADAPLMEEIKAVMRTIRDNSRVFTAVQLAASLVLSARTELSVCDDIVEHYWGGPRAYYHYQMNRMFPNVMQGGGIADPDMEIAPLNPSLTGKLGPRIAARIKRIVRGAGPDYGYAYMAYLSALSLRDTDRDLANVWAVTALNMLRWGIREPQPQARKDFWHFAPERIEAQGWMQPELRKKWREHWGA